MCESLTFFDIVTVAVLSLSMTFRDSLVILTCDYIWKIICQSIAGDIWLGASDGSLGFPSADGNCKQRLMGAPVAYQAERIWHVPRLMLADSLLRTKFISSFEYYLKRLNDCWQSGTDSLTMTIISHYWCWGELKMDWLLKWWDRQGGQEFQETNKITCSARKNETLTNCVRWVCQCWHPVALKVYSHENVESLMDELLRKASRVVRPLAINVKPAELFNVENQYYALWYHI